MKKFYQCISIFLTIILCFLGCGVKTQIETGGKEQVAEEVTSQFQTGINQFSYQIFEQFKLKQEAMQNVKNELAESVTEDTVMILIAFLSVAINIFLFIKKNKKAIGIYKVLGMEKKEIYGMVCLQSVINISIAGFVILLLYQYKSFRHDMLGEYHLSIHNFIVTVIFIMIYLLVAAVVLKMTLRKEG